MEFRILIIKNRLETSINDDLTEFERWVSERTPIKIIYDYLITDLDLKHKSFGIFGKDDKEQELYGLDGVKQQLRDLGEIKDRTYNTIIFFYDIDETGFDYIKNSIAHWTYFKQLQNAEFIEIATSKEWDKIGDPLRVLTHEIFHAWHNICRRAGIATKDTMDQYDKEFDILAKDGNRARNLKELSKYWKTITQPPVAITFMKILITYLLRLVGIYNKKISENDLEKVGEVIFGEKKIATSRLKSWAEAIKTFEGWYVGSRSYRNNNPGNLRWSKYQIGSDGGYSIFEDYNTGMKALLFQLQIAVDGRSKVYNPEMSLLTFFKFYAPSSDNNYPEVYAKFVAKKLDVNINTKIKDLA